MLIDELIEKAFCDGYEYAQKEFNNRAQKMLRNKFDISRGYKNLSKEANNPNSPFRGYFKERLKVISPEELKREGRISAERLLTPSAPKNINEKITLKQGKLDDIKRYDQEARKAAYKGGKNAYETVVEYQEIGKLAENNLRLLNKYKYN